MHGHKDPTGITCARCRESLQDYLDGTLDKGHSLEIFLHLRDCGGCRSEHAALQDMYRLLDGLPAQQPPADFDAAILASVPYGAYKAMEPLRRARIPVFLEEHALPGFVRSPVTRLCGLAVAVLAGVLALSGDGPQAWWAVAALGVVPEALVRLQGLGRSAVLALRRSES